MSRAITFKHIAQEYNLPVTSSVKINEGDLCYQMSDGTVTNVAAAGRLFRGVATETADNLAGDNGGQSVSMARGIFSVSGAVAITEADAQKTAWAAADSQVALVSGAIAVPVGVVDQPGPTSTIWFINTEADRKGSNS